ncbi:MAG: M28 family peptidase [Cyanobacteria bacterium SZAS-4]|nr:M28 family peptidase [Cyanobacteria bacterium SZAS-4]
MNQKAKYSIICAVIVLGTMAAFYWRVTWHLMPGQSFKGPLPGLSSEESAWRDFLSGHLDVLANQIGERNSKKYSALQKAADYITQQFKKLGYEPKFQEFDVDGQKYKNIEVELPGSDPDLAKVIVGAHYDSAIDSPGANDNASGVACLLELARALHGKSNARTIKIVALTNGEAPFQSTPNSGSYHYAQLAKSANAKIKGMLSLDEIGYYTDSPNSEKLPVNVFSYYPAEGNFVMVVADPQSANLCRSTVGEFRAHAKFPMEGIICQTSTNPQGMIGADHCQFWKAGYPAVMLTDTGSDRYPNVHSQLDNLSQIDTDKLSRVVGGLTSVVSSLANN